MDVPKKTNRIGGRSMRQKAKRVAGFVHYDDDEEIEGRWNFDLEEKLTSDRYDDMTNCYIELKGSDVTLSYFQRNGFSTPLLVREKTGLGMRIPSENFSVSDVQRCVGSRRVLDVMDVSSQKALEMTVKDWVQYYENKSEHVYRLLNVISLEFSHTRLEDYVDQPTVVHEMDWIDTAWPWFYKELQTQSTNALDGMMYPKVQKYCLMSVAGCYTDFHIDMGGTSVWYHILRGQKVFWLIEPTEENLALYVSWTLSTKQNDIFFGDLVDICHRVTLEAGSTFFIPTAWIHAVFTPEDSLVFGGNFLHSYSIKMQLRANEIEAKTHVPLKFRYPFFKELHWYVLERYVGCLTGREHRVRSDREIRAENGDMDDAEEISDVSRQNSPEKKPSDEKSLATAVDNSCRGDDSAVEMSLSLVCNDDDEEIISSDDVGANSRAARVCGSGKITSEKFPGLDSKLNIVASHPRKASSDQKAGSTGRVLSTAPLTPFEIEGLEAIVDWLEDLPSGKRNVPKDIPDPDGLLRAVRVLLNRHRMDDPVQAVTGLPILQWPPRKPVKQRRSKSTNIGNTDRKSGTKSQSSTGGTKTTGTKAGSKARRRRVRCNKCEPCTRENCRECIYCLDLKKYGGAQKLKKPCVSRVCLAPMLSKEAVCEICDGGDTDHDWPPEDTDDWSTWLMECRICHDITHPECLRQKCTDSKHSGVVDEDFPSSWDCIRCCEDGLQGQCRQRQSYGRTFRDRQSIGSADCDDTVMSAGKPDVVSSPSRSSVAPGGSSVQCHATETECSVKLERVAMVTAADNFSSVDVKPVVERSSADTIARLRAFGIKKPKLHLVRVHGSGSADKQKDSCGKTSLGKKTSTATKSSSSVAASPPKKKPCSGNTGSSHDVANYESLDFLQQTRVNSRGREISLPRRYLL